MDDAKIPVTLFSAPHRWAVKGTRREVTWQQLRAAFQRPELWPGEPTTDASEARLGGITFAWLRDDSRVMGGPGSEGERETESRVERVGGLVVDYLDEPLADEEHLRRWWAGIRFLACTSAWHEQPMGDRPAGPRWRLLIPFSRPVTLDDAVRVGQWVLHPRRGAGSVSDGALHPARVVAMPAVNPGGFAWLEGHGDPLDPAVALRDLGVWDEEERRTAAARAVAGATLREAVDAFRARIADPSRRALLPWPGQVHTLPHDGEKLDLGRLAARHGAALASLGNLAGSLWPGRLAVLVGGSGSGRTALALGLAEAAAAEGHPVLYAAADLPADEVVARLLVLRAANGGPAVPATHAGILEGEADATALLDAAAALVDALPNFYLWTPTTEERTDEALRARAAGVAAASEGRPPLVIVDPVEGFEDGKDLERAYRELSAACRDLVRAGALGPRWPGAAVLAVVGVPVELVERFATATALDDAAEPTARAHLRQALAVGIGGLGGDASLVLGLARDPAGPDGVSDAVVAVLKNRHGHTGAAHLRFHGAAGVLVARD